MQGVERTQTFGATALQMLMKLRQGDLHVRYVVLTMPNRAFGCEAFRATAQPLNAARFAGSDRFPCRGKAMPPLIL